MRCRSIPGCTLDRISLTPTKRCEPERRIKISERLISEWSHGVRLNTDFVIVGRCCRRFGWLVVWSDPQKWAVAAMAAINVQVRWAIHFSRHWITVAATTCRHYAD